MALLLTIIVTVLLFQGIDDIGDIFDEVEKLSPKWKLLTTKLRLRNHVVENIQENCSDVMSRLDEALKEWLKLNYNHKKIWKTKLAEVSRGCTES